MISKSSSFTSLKLSARQLPSRNVIFTINNSTIDYQDFDFKHFNATVSSNLPCQITASLRSGEKLLTRFFSDFYFEDYMQLMQDAYGLEAEMVYHQGLILLSDLADALTTDFDDRACALSNIDGKIYKGRVHQDAIEEYLGNIVESDYRLEHYQEELGVPVGFGSLMDGFAGRFIVVYECSNFNISVEDLADSFLTYYPGVRCFLEIEQSGYLKEITTP